MVGTNTLVGSSPVYARYPERGMRIALPPAWYEKGLVLFGFVILLGIFRDLLLGGNSNRTDGSFLFQLVAGVTYLSGILLLLIRGIPSWALTILVRAWPLVLLTLLTGASVFWSQEPATTLRRSIALILSTSFAIYIVVRFDYRSALNLFAIAMALFMGVGILAAAIPGVGITPSGAYAGALRGLAGNKNVFGRTIAIGVAILPLAAFLGLLRWRQLVLLAAPIAVMLLLLAKSATAAVAAFGSLGIGLMLYASLGGHLGRFRIRTQLGIPVLLVVATTIALVVAFGWTPIAEALGRDPTLTGRTKLWSWAMQINEDRPWLGSGYRSFWIDKNTLYFSDVFSWGQDADGVRSDTNRGPDHSHSGYLDTYLDLGVLGVGSLLLVIGSALTLARRRMIQGDEKLGLLFIVLLSFLLVYAITEQSILQQSGDLWFMFSMLYLYLVKAGVFREHRRPRVLETRPRFPVLMAERASLSVLADR